jgi:hypothetical protein
VALRGREPEKRQEFLREDVAVPDVEPRFPGQFLVECGRNGQCAEVAIDEPSGVTRRSV